jgi:hypothetical protein
MVGEAKPDHQNHQTGLGCGWLDSSPGKSRQCTTMYHAHMRTMVLEYKNLQNWVIFGGKCRDSYSSTMGFAICTMYSRISMAIMAIFPNEAL